MKDPTSLQTVNEILFLNITFQTVNEIHKFQTEVVPFQHQMRNLILHFDFFSYIGPTKSVDHAWRANYLVNTISTP